MQKALLDGNVIQKIYAVASRTTTEIIRRARGPKTRDPNVIPTKKEDSVSTDLVHLAPCLLREVHLVDGMLGKLVHIVTIEENDDEEELATGLNQVH